MILEIDLQDKSSRFAGLDFALSALSMEQKMCVSVVNLTHKNLDEATLEKLRLLETLGLENIYYVSDPNIEVTHLANALPFKPLSYSEYQNLYSVHDKIISF
ncbi:MAG: hypothetical protein K6L76_03450 [Agarilytica sp.]